MNLVQMSRSLSSFLFMRRSHSLPANVKPSVRTEFSLTHAPPLFCRIPPWFR